MQYDHGRDAFALGQAERPLVLAVHGVVDFFRRFHRRRERHSREFELVGRRRRELLLEAKAMGVQLVQLGNGFRLVVGGNEVNGPLLQPRGLLGEGRRRPRGDQQADGERTSIHLVRLLATGC